MDSSHFSRNVVRLSGYVTEGIAQEWPCMALFS